MWGASDSFVPPGIGAPVLTTVVGPLTEARYQIEIGAGGVGAVSDRAQPLPLNGPYFKLGPSGAFTIFSWGELLPVRSSSLAANLIQSCTSPSLLGGALRILIHQMQF